MKKLMNHKALFLILCQLSIANYQLSIAKAQHLWSFDECVQYAINHNINIQQRIIDVQVHENDLNTIQNDWMPTLSATTAQRFSFGNALASTGTMPSSDATYNSDLSYTNGAIELAMPIFDGYRRINQERAVHWSVEQATASLASARKNLSIQIKKSHF